MKYKLEITKDAILEINQNIDWYNKQKNGLGNKFFKELKKTIKQLSQNPFIYEKRYKNFHCAKLSVFPFIVIYFIENPNIVVVIAVFHTSRNPISIS
jgi:mRNA-degrading endonuclease RelE of RelBE toxin-antitoxin system